MIAILTLPVLLYQLAFVLILLVASRLGRIWLNVALVASLLWTATHVFLPPLAVLQATVILVIYFLLRGRASSKTGTASPPPSH